MNNSKKSILTAIIMLVFSMHLSASAVLLDVKNGSATFLADIAGGAFQKIGAGTLVLSGTNTLTSLDIADGTISVNGASNLGGIVAITLSSSGTLELQDTARLITGGTGGTTISTLDLFYGDGLIVNTGTFALGASDKLPSAVNSISGNAVVSLAAGGSAGAISSLTNFTGTAQLTIPASVTAGSITGPVTFARGAAIVLGENASDAGILGTGGSFTFHDGSKLILGVNSSWTSAVTVEG